LSSQGADAHHPRSFRTPSGATLLTYRAVQTLSTSLTRPGPSRYVLCSQPTVDQLSPLPGSCELVLKIRWSLGCPALRRPVPLGQDETLGGFRGTVKSSRGPGGPADGLPPGPAAVPAEDDAGRAWFPGACAPKPGPENIYPAFSWTPPAVIGRRTDRARKPSRESGKIAGIRSGIAADEPDRVARFPARNRNPLRRDVVQTVTSAMQGPRK
jgi:hypothetical protein